MAIDYWRIIIVNNLAANFVIREWSYLFELNVKSIESMSYLVMRSINPALLDNHASLYHFPRCHQSTFRNPCSPLIWFSSKTKYEMSKRNLWQLLLHSFKHIATFALQHILYIIFLFLYYYIVRVVQYNCFSVDLIISNSNHLNTFLLTILFMTWYQIKSA